MSLSMTSGFAALPSKPDFAFPKTVIKQSDKALETALKAGDGPATVRSLINYSLAETAIEPDKTEATAGRIESVEAKVKQPVTKAMLMLLRADMTSDDSLALATFRRYGEELRRVPIEQWKGVVTGSREFFPTLYDFAAAQAPLDSVASDVISAYPDNAFVRCYWAMQLARNSSEKMLEVYRTFAGDEVSAYPLAELAGRAHETEQRQVAYRLAQEWLELHGRDSSLHSLVEKTVSYLCRPSVRISGPQMVARGEKYQLKVSAICVRHATVTQSMRIPSISAGRAHRLKFEGEGVFQVDTILELTFDKYGRYRLTPSFDGMSARQSGHTEVIVTDMLPVMTDYGSKSDILILDATDGHRLPEARMETTGRNRSTAMLGNDRYGPDMYTGSRHYSPDGKLWNYSANILTDRSIYHPGDELRFAATLMRTRPGEQGLDVGAAVKATLYNANYQAVDTMTLTSDSMGRIAGAFRLPDTGLTGMFRVEIADRGAMAVMVTDYKAPTFDPTVKVTRLSDTEIEISGTAIGYNGFPIADASARISVRELPRWIWYYNYRNSGGEQIGEATATTDAEGKYSVRITIPAGLSLGVTATVASPTGETHDATGFVPFMPYFITADIPAYVRAGNAPAIQVFDSNGEKADIPLTIALTPADNKSGLITPDPKWENVPSGVYTLRVSASTPGLADTLTRENIVVYRPADAMPPTPSALFVPVTSAQPGEKLLVGTSYADSHILYTLWTPEKILKQQWLTPGRGNGFMEMELPDSITSATLTLMTMRDFRLHRVNIEIRRPSVPTSLKMEISTLRDKVTPGNRETWSIKVTDNLGRPVEAAVMLDVYSKALDALRPFEWHFYKPSVPGNYLSASYPQSWETSAGAGSNATAPRLKWWNQRAGFELYGQHWPYIKYGVVTEECFGLPVARNMMITMKSAVTSAGALSADIEEDAAEDSLAENTVMVSESKAAADADGDAGATSAGGDDDGYRMPETPVAMWRPVLTTDTDGNARIEFTVPNATTTWRLRGLAYDASLLSGTFGYDFIASKPVMVQPQTPRFMRVGDRTELRANIMNDTDSAAEICATIEVYNPVTDSIYSSRKFHMTIDARSSHTVSTEFTAPDASMAGIRVKATDGRFTDGEQSVMAILPSGVTVRTGRPLFLPADSAATTVDVPRGGTLTFTANAIWECVTALPGLRALQRSDAFSSVSALYSAATARGLMRSYPAIGSALKRWENSDSVLISRLEKNPDLKIAMLEDTPWPGAAMSQTERMSRLLLLFDNKAIDSTIRKATDNLARLVRRGGLTWTPDGDEASEWVTISVLYSLAMLERQGYLPDSRSIQQIIREGVQYLDNTIAKDFARHPDAIYPDYVEMRDAFSHIRRSAPAQRAANHTVQYIVGHWRDFSFDAMARAAIILNANGYRSTARQILESLRQHEAWRQVPVNGRMLEAFALVEPSCAEVDIIRTYYIERKQAMDWGDGINTSLTVASILNSGSRWLVPAENELSVKVNGVTIEPDAESVMGQFRLDLPDGGSVRIQKGAFPAWGGVYSRSDEEASEVAAASSDALSMTRSISGDMTVGSKVTVTLEIDCDRPLDFVVVKAPRCAAFETVNQLPGSLWMFGRRIYREPSATETTWFFNRLSKGKTTITEKYYVTQSGRFALAPAEIQSQYAPEFQARTSGSTTIIED